MYRDLLKVVLFLFPREYGYYILILYDFSGYTKIFGYDLFFFATKFKHSAVTFT
ncbi:hypothetical protein BDC45DRAFT_504624 [Circinella umbellata]|nr:hypothetical protein BDC45DRAFT_504624 [Circinella umbellata]